MFASGLLLNAPHHFFARRMGLFPNTISIVVYVLVFTVGLAWTATKYGAPTYCVSLPVAIVFIIVMLRMQSNTIKRPRQVLQETQRHALAC